MNNAETKRIVRYFGAIQLLFYAATALWGYCNVYFRELGFTGQEIGFMNAAGTALLLVELPVLGIISDRIRSHKKVLRALLLITFPLYLLVPVCGALLGRSAAVFSVLIALLVSGGQAAIAMMDAWNGEVLERLQLSYGSVRRYGSLGYIVMVLLASALVGPVLPAWSCCILMPLTAVPLLALVWRKQPWETPSPREEAAVTTGGLASMVLKNYYFVAFLLFVAGYYGYVSVVDLDISYLMDYIGVRQSALGIVHAVRASLEIVAMIVLGRQKKLPPLWLMLTAAGLLAAAENLLYVHVHGMGAMLAVTLLSGIGGGMFYGFCANYVLRIVDHRAAGTAMSLIGTVRAMVSIVSMALGGTVIDRFGVTTLTSAVGLLLLVLTLLFAAATLAGRRILHLPYLTQREELP